MHLLLNDSNRLFTRTQVIIISCFLILILTIPMTFLFHSVLDYYGNLVTIEGCSPNYVEIFTNLGVSCDEFVTANPENLPKIIGTLTMLYDDNMIWTSLVLLLLGGMSIWFIVIGRKVKKNLENLKRQYVRQAYYLVLQTSTHENKNIPLEFVNIAEDIFPELKEHIHSMKKKGREWYELEVKKDDVVFDLLADTREGKFIVEFSDAEVASYDKIKQVLEAVKRHYKDENVFRTVILARKFDNVFYATDEKSIDKCNNLDKYGTSFDLITVDENGFNFLRVGR